MFAPRTPACVCVCVLKTLGFTFFKSLGFPNGCLVSTWVSRGNEASHRAIIHHENKRKKDISIGANRNISANTGSCTSQSA